MMAYEAGKRYFNRDYALGLTHEIPLERRMMSGATAGVVGWLSIYPLDVLRSRINAQGAGHSAGSALKYTGAIDCAVKTWR